MSLGDEKYLALTTFKRDGTPVTTAVWAAPIDDNKIGFWTSSGSGKAKRLAHTSKVVVQPSDARGRVKAGTSPVDATAVLVTGPQLEGIRTKIRAKYGVMCSITKFLNKVGGIIKRKRIPYGDRGVLITPSGEGSS
jgi:PPOX class probable F420-dependent enzyme